MTSPDSTELGFQSIVRVGLLKTVSIFLILIIGYGYVFLDAHLEWFVESQATQLLGTEVNIEELETGWISPAVSLNGLRVTDPDKPTRNWIEINELSARLSGYSLLKMKYVVERSTLDGIHLGTPRSHRGWVAEEGGDVHWVFDSTKSLFSTELSSQTSGSLLGQGLEILSGASPDEVLDRYRENLKLPGLLDQTRSTYRQSSTRFREETRNLPSEEELNQIKQTIKQLSSGGDGLRNLMERRDTIKDLTDRLKQYKSSLESFSKTLKSTSSDLGNRMDELDQAYEEDRQRLLEQVSLPSLETEGMSQRILRGFVRRRLGSVADYLEYVQPYITSSGVDTSKPNNGSGTAESTGRDYRFSTVESTPGFWLQSFKLRSGQSDDTTYQFEAEIRHLTTNPRYIEEPLELSFHGQRLTTPAVQYNGFLRSRGDQLSYQFSMDDFAINNWFLTENNSLQLGVKQGLGSLQIEGANPEGTIQSTFDFQLRNPDFVVESTSQTIVRSLRENLRQLSPLRIEATMSGLDETTITIRSNLDQILSGAISSLAKTEMTRFQDSLKERYRKEYGAQTEVLGQDIGQLLSSNREILSEKQSTLDSITEQLRSRIKSSPLQLDRFSIPTSSGS